MSDEISALVLIWNRHSKQSLHPLACQRILVDYLAAKLTCDDLEMEVKMKKAKAKPRSKPIVLRFTYAQAHALSAVLRYVGGNPEPGDPRYLIDEIQHMLRQGREFDYTVFEVTRPHYSSGLHIARR